MESRFKILTVQQTNIKKLVLSSILTAIGTAILILSSFFRTIDLTLAVVASLFALFARLEIGRNYALLVYAATSVLALILCPTKFSAFVYLGFAGFYPIIKPQFERLPKFFSYLLKLLLFNVALSLLLLLCIYVLKLPTEQYGFSLLIYILGNVTFIIYDLALSQMVYYYAIKLRKRLKIQSFFK